MTTVQLAIDGMHCDGCVRRVEKVLRSVTGLGVEGVTVGSATLKLDVAGVSADDAVKALAAHGFSARKVGANERE